MPKRKAPCSTNVRELVSGIELLDVREPVSGIELLNFRALVSGIELLIYSTGRLQRVIFSSYKLVGIILSCTIKLIIT